MNAKLCIALLLIIAVSSGIVRHLLCSLPDARGVDYAANLGERPSPAFSDEPIRPLPGLPALDARKVALGKQLFCDTRLSADNTVACVSCHSLQTAGADGRTVSQGIYHRQGRRNAPTVFNCGLNYRQFWDGRASSLEMQIDSPLQSPDEMGANWPDVIQTLRRDSDYAAKFARLYPDGIRPASVRDAIAVFERSLTTPGARFDRYLQGDKQALSQAEQSGYRRFKSYGCVSCHQGVNVGGNLMQPFGVMANPKEFRYQSGKPFQLHLDAPELRLSKTPPLFKVPGLRNVARTAPYFHDGSAKSLPAAIQIMGYCQLGRQLSHEDIMLIAAFLKTLTGAYEGKEL